MEQSHVSNTALVIGVDVGGTKIAAGVVDSQGNVSGQVMQPTDTASPESTLRSIARCVTSVIQATGDKAGRICAIGLGIPGMIDPVRGICLHAVNLNWRNVPVRDWLEQELGLPCAIENDVSAAALGESRYGAGKGLEQMVYLSLGTGIAARMIIQGNLYRGAHGMAGEIGHTVFHFNGPLCRCGARGCLEALAAGPALALNAQQELQNGKASLLQNHQAREIHAEHVFEAAAQNDALAQQILHDAGMQVAYGIYLLVMSYDPQCVIIGGGLAHEQSPLIAVVKTGIEQWKAQSPIFHAMMEVDGLRVSSLQRDAGIIGAAALVAAEKRIVQ
jgi:glucokinase